MKEHGLTTVRRLVSSCQREACSVRNKVFLGYRLYFYDSAPAIVKINSEQREPVLMKAATDREFMHTDGISQPDSKNSWRSRIASL